MTGPLKGIRIIEIGGIGPVPFAGMMLADHGAEVIRIERVSPRGVDASNYSKDVLLRSRRIVPVNIRTAEGIAVVRDLVMTADGLIEGFRPGVMERLGLGPDTLMRDKKKLIYGRMTGWGQTGPLKSAAGHDINYIALSGALHAFGRFGEKPTAPLNLVGDFGGGAMMLIFGMLAALLHIRNGGDGQVVDCAMTDGSALLTALIWGFRARDRWSGPRGANTLDGGAHFYDTYETADGKWVSIGPLEPKFYSLFLEKVGLAGDTDFAAQMNSRRWPSLKEKLSAVFFSKTQEEWCALLEGTDACFAPVLDFDQADAHPHNVARGTFVTSGGVRQPAPAPRYSTLETTAPRMADGVSAAQDVLSSIGYDIHKIAALKDSGTIE